MLHFLSYNIVATLISLMLSVNKYNLGTNANRRIHKYVDR